MTLKDLGEFGFINRFHKKYFSKPLPKGYLGIGDDCAVLPAEDEILISTDMLVENVHFITDEIGGFQLGKKSLAVNLSDLAASGAYSCGSFLSLAIPEKFNVDFFDDFFKGYAFWSEKFSCPLLGGDTTKSLNSLIINVTVVGKTKNKKLRSTAKQGDIICVTGFLGDSAAGLDFLLKKQKTSQSEYFIEKHHNPIPRIEEGCFLSSQSGVNAMTDLSDGLSSDLKHIAELSNISCVVELNNLPLSENIKNVFSLKQCYDFATCGGEDYELLLTVDSQRFAKINLEFEKKFSRPLYPIGKIIEKTADDILFLENSFPINSFSNGYDHFSC